MRTMRLLIPVFLLFSSAAMAFGASGTVGEIATAVNDGEIVKFSVNDVSVKGMKGKALTFAFKVAQAGEWLEDSWVTVDMGTAKFDPVFWNGEACWFQYNVQELIQWGGDLSSEFIGTFFIVDTAKNKTIAKKEITFMIEGTGNNDETTSEDTGDNTATGDFSTNVSAEYSESALTIEIFPGENEITVSGDTYDRVKRDIMAQLTFELNLYKNGKLLKAGLSKNGGEGNNEIFGWSHSWKFKKNELGKGKFKAEVTVKDIDGQVMAVKEKEFSL